MISDGGFTFNQQSNWNASGTVKNAYFISGYTSTTPCPSTKNISVGNNTNFNSFVNVFFYTPCTATLANQNNFIGQALAGTALIAQQVHDDLQGGPRPRSGNGERVQPGHRLRARDLSLPGSGRWSGVGSRRE